MRQLAEEGTGASICLSGCLVQVVSVVPFSSLQRAKKGLTRQGMA